MNLFMIYLGGKHKNSLIELHDIRFAAANSIEETYEELKASWWGTPSSLHLDCWGILKQVDGYDIHLKDFPSQQSAKLYFINLGGYDPSQFTELHQNFCLVAENELDAKKKAIKQVTDWKLPHKDYIHSVEDIVDIQNSLANKNLYIHVELTPNPSTFEFTCNYVPLSK